MKIQRAAEDYLKTVLTLKRKNGHVRSVDIADELGVSKPTVSVAIKQLTKHGYIIRDERHEIALTDQGYKIAEGVYDRFTVFSEFLKQIGVDPETAGEDACKLEHAISEESFEAIKAFLTVEMTDWPQTNKLPV